MSQTLYLDNAATTRVIDPVFEAMRPYFCDEFGNASAKYYGLGARARAAVFKARCQLAALLNATLPEDEDHPSEIIFTSGATESSNWILKNAHTLRGGARGTPKPAPGAKPHLITSSIEHHSVLETAQALAKAGTHDVTFLPVDAHGLVDPDALRHALRDDTVLVSIMLANNEVGTIQPIRELAAIAHERGALFHTDAVQAVGKVRVDVRDLDVDGLSVSSHKFHGPKGVGGLYLRRGVRIDPYQHGGGQERGRRAGTTNVPGIVGMGAAAELAGARLEAEYARQFDMIEHLWQALEAAVPKMYRNGHPSQRLPNTLNIRVQGAEGEAILLRLDMFGIQVASGSACSTDSLEPSHVLMAMGIAQEDAHGSLRISISHETTAAELERVAEILPEQIRIIREMSVTWNG